ncbi:IucA/IucC family protein [Paenibacillus harenae]|uniref:IucA/IucC family protein n=1 Tax=Paenibacillus harenae TaxID=306543 RepID=UPI0004086EFD|nr:IucA/IucC family protein [Paenibacillus harenae]
MKMYAEATQVYEAILSPAYVQARRRVLRQLLEALIYEGIVHSERREIAGETEFIIRGKDGLGQSVKYVCIGRERFTFGRIRLKDRPIMRCTRETEQEAESPSLLMQELCRQHDVPETKLHAFIQELEQTLLNDTLAQHKRATEGTQPLHGLSYDKLESALMDGHPYHPCYKSRIGFSVSDHYAYGPEFEAEVKPVWIALCKELAGQHVLSGLAYRDILLLELGEGQLSQFDSVLREHNREPAEYVYLPVHPWQWTHRVLQVFSMELRNKQMICLGESEVGYRPQQSIRTLANHANPVQSYLKLSLHITNTSSLRSLTPHSLATAPLVSAWLNQIVQRDAFLRDEARVVLLMEYAGVSYDPHPHAPQSGQDAGIRPEAYGVIGCLWRESLHRYLEAGEEAVPMNALSAVEINGTPFIDPWVRCQGVRIWLRRLLAVCMLPVVHLLAGHGLALESHAQNIVLLHRQGIPVRTAWKDFHEGVEYHPAYLKEPARCPDFASAHPYYSSTARNEGFAMDSLQLVKELMTDCLFFMNLGELALLLEDHYAFDERQFWELVYEMLAEHIGRFPELEPRFQELDLFTPACRVEQLTRRRLYQGQTLMVHEAPNPLYPASSNEIWKGDYSRI